MDLAPLSLVVAVNNEDVLNRNLRSSPYVVAHPQSLQIMKGYSTAGAAYNDGLDAARSDYVVFVHQDVYLPRGWEECLTKAIADIERADPNWGVLGVFGISESGDHIGRVWSTGLGRELGEPLDAPCKAVSADELLLVVRRESGLKFDEQLPSFHLFATDIMQTARSRSLGTYIFDGPVVHNSVSVESLRGGYWAAYKYLRRKWHSDLPLTTLVAPITKTGWPFWRRELRWLVPHRGQTEFHMPNQKRAASLEDPVKIARSLGYE